MTRAEEDLDLKFYKGEHCNFTFEHFAEIHQQAHTDLEEFGEPLTETAKVRKFLKQIQALFLNSAIATVCANPYLKNDFEATVNFLRLRNRIKLSFGIFCQVNLVAIKDKVKDQVVVKKVAVVAGETKVSSTKVLQRVWWISIILLMNTRV
jgi:hypothetical protein